MWFSAVAMNHPSLSRRAARGGTVVAITLAATLGSQTAAQAAVPRITAPRNLDTLVAWYDITQTAVDKPGWTAAGNTQITASRTWAAAWSAADEALGKFNAERGTRRKGDAGARRVLVGQAIRDVLVKLTPAIKPAADTQLFYTIQGAGTVKPNTIKFARRLGRAAAKKWLANRVYDALDVDSINIPYIAPKTPALGEWRPTPPAFANGVQWQQSKGRPFIDPNVAEQIAPAPPAIDSPEVIADLNEINTLGGTSSAQTAARGAARTRIARFWSQTSVAGFQSILREVLLGEDLTLNEQVHLLSVFHRVTTDVQIATYASKYKYLRWRPITALRTDDGNPNTPYNPNFTPLITTPAHPEYPSGHVAYATAADRVLKALVDPLPRGPISATSTALPGTVISYLTWDEITDANVNARVWSGIHLRSTDNLTRTWATKLAKQLLRDIQIDPNIGDHSGAATDEAVATTP